jgi:hypothetical protein
MRHPLILSAVFTVGALLAGAGALSGCHRGELPPATTLAVSSPATGPGESAIVFMRPPSPCDESDYTVVVDDEGHFVGNIAPGTRVQLSVTPGVHTFFAWSSLDQRVEYQPAYLPVAAVRVNATGPQTDYVALLIHKIQHECRTSVADMEVVGNDADTLADVQQWLAATTAVQPDRRSGQAALDSKSALLGAYLDMGHAKLRLIEQGRLQDERYNAIRAEKQLQ